jgi:hypothetical protein
MILTSLLTVVLVSLTGTSSAQQAPIVYDSIHNVTPIGGTWSSGSQNVLTGPGFANPVNMSFVYPKTTGLSYSFTNDGFYEIARYRFTSNGSDPTCITGVVVWVHGTYVLEPNGSIVTTPFGDGYQQVQDPCAAVSNFIQLYNDTELYQSWRIFQDPTTGPHLNLYQFDGSPLPPMFQVSVTPNMLPTQPLRNVTVASSTPSRRSASSSAERLLGPQWALGVVTAVAAVSMVL